jgi:hypothetical protein
VDILFTSEAMNLASLYRLMPRLAKQPSVVYFHENQIFHPQAPVRRGPKSPEDDDSFFLGSGGAVAPPAVIPRMAAAAASREVDLELVNLNTATAATEIWFNSDYHHQTFLAQAAKLVGRHPEISSRNPMPDVTIKSQVMPPPIDLNLVPHVQTTNTIPLRDPRAIFVDTRDANVPLLNSALTRLTQRGEKFRLITVGPIEDLSDAWPRRTVSESQDVAHVLGLLESAVVLSVRPTASFDLQVIRGLQAGCRPVLPDRGIYPDLIPEESRDQCLYNPTIDALADALQDAINPPLPWFAPDFTPGINHFEAIAATKMFDERLTQLAIEYAAA